MLHLSSQAQTAEIAGSPPFVYLTAVLPTDSPTPTPQPTPIPTPTGWLAYLNYYRASSSLPVLAEVSTMSQGAELHSRYTVKNNYVGHYEDPGNPWYTWAGAITAQNSNVLGVWELDATDYYAIDIWLQAPFHALGMIDPQLQSTGFGSYCEDVGNIRMGATLDVLRGRYGVPSWVEFPIMWPGDEATLHMSSYVGGYPSPLTSCPGYSAPSGHPIYLQLGTGYTTPFVTASSLLKDGLAVEHCLFDETSYSNPNLSEEYLGRSILAARNAIVIMPRKRLIRGATYTVSVTVNGKTHTWSFDVAEDALSAEELVAGQGVSALCFSAPPVPASDAEGGPGRAAGSGPSAAAGAPGAQ